MDKLTSVSPFAEHPRAIHLEARATEKWPRHVRLIIAQEALFLSPADAHALGTELIEAAKYVAHLNQPG